MNTRVASLDLCKELYALSEWADSRDFYDDQGHVRGLFINYAGEVIPAYDLAYLVALLPAFELRKHGNDSYEARWTDYTSGRGFAETSRTKPANAVARLAITLFKQGILLSVNRRADAAEEAEAEAADGQDGAE